MDSGVSELHSRARVLFDEFEQGEGASYIDKAIVIDRKALELCPPGHGERAVALTLLGNHLYGRYKQLGATGDINEAIALDREALDIRRKGDPDRSVSLINLALHLSVQYRHLGMIEDIEEAIVLSREALNLRPKGHPDRSMSLNNLALHLSTRYKQLGAIEDLEEAIVLSWGALSLRLEGHPDRSMSLNDLALHLSTRYDRLGAIEDLEEAIVFGREALSLRPNGHPDRSMSLNNLALHLSTRYNQLGAIEDLEEAIVLSWEALSLRPEGHPDRSMSLNNLALHLSFRYDQFGAIEDLEEAIVFGREALSLRRKGHVDRSMSLNNLALHLSIRYNRLGAIEDIEEATALSREALSLRQKGHPDRSMSLDSLAAVLSTWYKEHGATEDLEEAIVLDREALILRPKGHPDRSSSLNSLALHLYTRYNQFGAIEDLEEMVVFSREALSLRPKGHPDRSVSLNNLAVYLSIRYRRLRIIEDLEEAIVLGRETLSLLPKGHPGHSLPFNNLAVNLSTRYEQLRIIEDLEEAIVLSKEALSLQPKGHSDRSLSLNNLAGHLSVRYDQLKVVEDLEEAIVLCREALDLQPQGHPERSKSLDKLASCLRKRFSLSRQLLDKRELFGLYTQLAHVDQFISSADVATAREWTRVAEIFQHPSLLVAYETALRLLIHHLATLPSLPQHHTIVKDFSSSLAVDAFSACLRNHVPARAVELLEQGRGVFWTQLTRLHSPLHGVAESGPVGKTLADQFTRLALDIRNTLNVSCADQHERPWNLNLEMQQVVTEIRKLPSLSRFLLPPLFSDLQHAAVGGPVIILNASEYSCDALIVFLNGDPVHIPLQVTREIIQDMSAELHTLTVRAKKKDMTRQLACFLREVWDRIVSPIVDVLQTILPSPSRIWWCPTSEFSLLPLHAAGPYRSGQRNLADLYISSYTPTLSALIRSRRRDRSISDSAMTHFVGIGQAEAKGENKLVSVGMELDNIAHGVEGLATFRRIDGADSHTERVVEELGRNEWVHLACHGIPNPSRPFESAFALRDGYFTIQQIIGCELKNPEFAYLSACHTTVGDEESLDEAIHLASAMQFIGFRSVIGTMWAVDDSKTTKITSAFYKQMVNDLGRLDYTRAAFALNRTMRSVNVPFDQRILYVHLGA